MVSSDLSLGMEPTAVRFDTSALPPLPYFEYEQGVRMRADEWDDGELEGCDCAPAGCANAESCPCNRYSCGRGLVECGPTCACARRPDCCPLRTVGSGARPALAVCRMGDARGWGVRAAQPISAGALVCEYGGELTRAETARAVHNAHDRARARGENQPFYLMAVREEVGAANARRALRSFINARLVGSVGRFLNHSCEPCLEPHTVRIGHVTPRVAFFARREICEGEELTYDYGCTGDSSDGVLLDASKAALGSGGAKDCTGVGGRRVRTIACLCGSKACRQFMPSL